ncbi:hypothetical protein HGRIS_010528 [Hohenbuehelia grisea]|uniref:Protein kinase domain-containing protein n=1 Tax=Hohenbuehelia grisea TaxID=104357 RepID=A0ABR3IXA8_9AGAR
MARFQHTYIIVDAGKYVPIALAHFNASSDATVRDLLDSIPTQTFSSFSLMATSHILTIPEDVVSFQGARNIMQVKQRKFEWGVDEVTQVCEMWDKGTLLSDILDRNSKTSYFIVPCEVSQLNLDTFAEEAPNRRNANIPSIRNQDAVAASIRAKVKPPSTSANNEQLIKTEHPNNNDAIYDGRPDSLTGPSITIYHPIFAEFQERLHDMPKPGDIPLEDVRAASLFISMSAQYFKTETDRQNALRPAVMHFLEGTFHETTLQYGRLSFKPDGHDRVACGLFDPLDAQYADMLSRIDEVNNGVALGDRDAIEQGAKGYLIVSTSPQLEKLRDVSCMPAFLLGIVGPFITVAGAIYLDGVVSQRLTPMISLVPDVSSTTPIEFYASEREKCVYQIANVFRALRHCQDKLRAEYLAMSAPTGAIEDVMVPAPHFSSFSPDPSTTFSLKYLCPFFPRRSNRAVFVAEARSGCTRMKCVVKFTARYCQEAHRLMEKAGVAPKLLYCKFEPTVGKFCVITQYIEGPKSDPNVRAKPTKEGVDKLRTALKKLHAQSYVFGDLRDANIILDKTRCPQLVDFDWSGKEGTVFYPSNLNTTEIVWAPGVKPGGKILCQHDEDMLEIFIRDLGDN